MGVGALCLPFCRCGRRGGVTRLASQLDIARKPDARVRDSSGCLQKGRLRRGPGNWVNPSDAAGKEQQAKLFRPCDALCSCPGVPSVLPESLLLHPLLGEHAGPLLPTPCRFVPRGVLGHSLLPRVLQRDITTSEQLHRECPLQTLWVLPFGSEPRGKKKGCCPPSSPHRAHCPHPGPGENLQGHRRR